MSRQVAERSLATNSIAEARTFLKMVGCLHRSFYFLSEGGGMGLQFAVLLEIESASSSRIKVTIEPLGQQPSLWVAFIRCFVWIVSYRM